MTTDGPDATWGREPTARVGNFACPCGHVVIDADRGDESVRVDIVEMDRGPISDRVLTCPECGREWWLEADFPTWVSDDERA